MPQLNANSGLSAEDVRTLISLIPGFNIAEPFVCDDSQTSLYRYLDAFGFNRLKGVKHHAFGFLYLKDYRVATHYWLSSADAPCVFIAHGLFDHVGLYLDLVEALLAEGFNVLAIDFPGHGLSDGEPAVIGDFYEYTQVVDEVLASVERDISQPIYAVGQSTGGAVLLSYVLVRRGEAFKKVVLLAPLVRPRGWRFIRVAYSLLSPVLRFVKRAYSVNSHRQGFAEFLARHDPLQPRRISVQWIGAMKRWINAFDQFEGADVPVLLVQGDRDATVDWRRNVPQIKAKFSRCQVVMVDGAMHHLVKEGDAWQSLVFTEVLSFLKSKSSI